MNFKINGNAVAPGTVISGTLRTEDLVRGFANEIKRLTTRSPAIVFEAELWLKNQTTEGAGVSILGDLEEHLNRMAPKGLRFGSHEGDGADFGWWECEE